MTDQHKISTENKWLTAAPIALGGSAALIGLVALFGWAFDSPVLKGFHPSFVTMKPNTAVGLVLLAVSVVLLGLGQERRLTRTLAGILSSVASAIGALSLMECVLVSDFGIDQLLFRELPGAIETWSPGRMALITSACFPMAGLALHMMAAEYRRIKRLPDILLSATALLALFVLLEYLFDESGLRALGMYGLMAINTAIAFLLICLGSFVLNPAQRIIAPVFTNTPTGIMLRWIFPAAIGVPILVGWLRWTGEQHGLYGTGIGVALSVVTTIALLLVLIRLGAAAISRAQSNIERLERTARENDRRLRALLNATHSSIYIFDREGRFVFANKHTDNLHHMEAGGLVGKTLFDLFPAEQVAIIHSHNARVWDSEAAIEIEETAQIPSGVRTYLSHKFPICDEHGKMVSLGGISHDITERTRMEEDLRRSEEKIKALNDDLTRQNLQLQAANGELESFSYSVSHDLRAPLRSIDGFSQALLEDYAGRLDDTGNDYLRRVRSATQKMGGLIDDMLQLSRVTRSALHRRQVDLTALAHAVVQDLRERYPLRSVDVVIEQNLTVEGDQGLLRTALDNLLGNAWKYTSKKQHAHIEFGCGMRNGAPAFFVRDDGVGFDMAYACKLFGAFQRLHGVEEFEGTGIGLVTVQRIIHRHGGQVWAEGTVDNGATFYFTLEPLSITGEDHERQDYSAGRGQPRRCAVDPARA